KPKTYQDSVRLMRISESLSSLEQVKQAIVAMGTAANKRVLAEIGLLTETVEQAEANDLVIVIEAESEAAAQAALAQAEVSLAEAAENGDREEQHFSPRTLEQARRTLTGANLALISVPGEHASIEAAKALN